MPLAYRSEQKYGPWSSTSSSFCRSSSVWYISVIFMFSELFNNGCLFFQFLSNPHKVDCRQYYRPHVSLQGYCTYKSPDVWKYDGKTIRVEVFGNIGDSNTTAKRKRSHTRNLYNLRVSLCASYRNIKVQFIACFLCVKHSLRTERYIQLGIVWYVKVQRCLSETIII
nr:MAG TPA: hypothetical protein [Bacteriophage sp.]